MATNETALTQAQIDRGEAPQGYRSSVNVGDTERWVSALGGGALALYGLTRGNLPGVALALLGASIAYRGFSGHCYAYQSLGIDTSGRPENPNISVPAGRGVKVEKSLTINRPAEELYRFWRNLENLPRVMSHLESVTEYDGNRSHWVAKAPAGTTVEWDAEITEDRPNELIAWRSLEGADVSNSGSVRFMHATGKRGTIVMVEIDYGPPGGLLGAAVAKLFGEEPAQQVNDDLRRFKQVVETGEVVISEGTLLGTGATEQRAAQPASGELTR